MRLPVLLAAAAFALAGCAALGDGEKTYTEPTFRYALTYPAS